jgi:DNA-binding MarR family transcriptional regulator
LKSGPPDFERSRRDELLGQAEKLCRTSHSGQAGDQWSDHVNPEEKEYALERASEELERLFLRRRLFTDNVFADRAWLIMVDLFASELQQIVVELDSAAERWNVSDDTATRQLATLIASGLIERLPSAPEGHHPALKLTERGHSAVAHILFRAV